MRMMVLAMHIGSITDTAEEWASPVLKRWASELPKKGFTVPSEASEAEWQILDPSAMSCDRTNEQSTSRNLRWLARQMPGEGSPIQVVNQAFAAKAQSCAAISLPQTEEQLTYNLLVVKTRAFNRGSQIACMVPTGDLLNHAVHANVEYGFSRNQDFTMRAREGIQMGQELLDSYGELKDAWEMLKG
jgi:hypothetical protein